MSREKLVAWWRKYRFHTLLFTTGSAILIVEVAATRIISPYYGNTIYTVSSVIGVTLGALSLGYYRGGKEGAHIKSMSGFYSVVLCSGVALLGLFFFTVMVLPYGGYLFSLRSGPIIWSLVLFFLPSYYMGKLSPLAIALSAKEHDTNIGEIVGSLFFWSTAGSILGAIGTGFILVPYFGIKSILFIVTFTILAIGGIGRIAHAESRSKERMMVDLIFLFLITIIIYAFALFYRTSGAVFVKDGVYEQIAVVDAVSSDHRNTRLLYQDRTTSSGMYKDSSASLFPYTDYFRLYRLTDTLPKSALFIGAGAYTMPKLLHSEVPDARIDVVEIEPHIEDIAHEYFALPETAMIRTYTLDGRMFLVHSTSSYDLIFSDVYYTMNSVPAHVTTKEFFRRAHARLSPKGIFLANIIGSNLEFPESMLYAEIRTMHTVFPFVSVFAVESATSSRMQNFILAGSNVPLAGEIDIAPPGTGEQNIAKERRIEKSTYRTYPVLTDDYAPTEYMAAALMRHYYDATSP